VAGNERAHSLAFTFGPPKPHEADGGQRYRLPDGAWLSLRNRNITDWSASGDGGPVPRNRP
jgi:hypothetical protein